MKEAPEIYGPGPIVTTSVPACAHHLLSPPCQLSYMFTLAVVTCWDLGGKPSKYSSPGLFLTFLPAQRIPLPPLAPIPWNWKLELDLHPILAAKPHHFQQ